MIPADVQAEKHCIAGASVWKRFSTEGGLNPDVVLVGCGVEVTFEIIAAAAILRNAGVRVRVVNINDLLILGETGQHPHALDEEAFESLFTANKPVIVNFHGYPKDISGLLFSRRTKVGRSRVSYSIPYARIEANDSSMSLVTLKKEQPLPPGQCSDSTTLLDSP
jgi:xylulose-5-phosphate/fructose-6-phosphate phosphoketolase